MGDFAVSKTPPGRKPVREPINADWVSLSEALTWIAFRHAMTVEELRQAVEGEPPVIVERTEEWVKESLRSFFANDDDPAPDVPGKGHFVNREAGLQQLTEAWSGLRHAVEQGTVAVRGQNSPTYRFDDAKVADVVDLTGLILATFSQLDLGTGGIRRQLNGSPDILWNGHTRSYDRELESFLIDARTADGYLFVEVCRADLMKVFRTSEKRGGRPRLLDHNRLNARAAELLQAQPKLSIGAAAASISEELGTNPKTLKPHDTRGIERIIAKNWSGDE